MNSIILKINSTLSDIVELENELFGGGLLSIFVKKKFSVITTMLLMNAHHLSMYRDELMQIHETGIDSSLEISFIDALEASTLKMAHIAERLNRKSLKAQVYSMDEYKNDVGQLRSLQGAYGRIGELLNEKYR